MILRKERPTDARAIRALTKIAFAGAEHSSGNEAEIIAALREGEALALSLVMESSEGLIGHCAFSKVEIGDGSRGWLGLGPVSVDPEVQGQGIGARLIREGLTRLARDHGAKGCVVLGDPGYYARFGFKGTPGLTFEGVPPEYFMQLAFDGPVPQGAVRYHPAFYL